jgi:hypothetical protein
MAKGRIRSRMELREQYDAAEARERADRDETEETDDEAEEVEGEPTEEAEGDEEEAKPVKKKKKPAAPKEPSKRKKTTKQVPKRVVWVIYDNSYKKVKSFPYNQRKEADEEAEKLRTEKKTTYFVQPFKEEITA